MEGQTPTVATVCSLLVWVFTGVIAGYIASVILRVERQGCIVNMLLGVAGAFIGSYLMSVLGVRGPIGIGLIDQVIHGVIGAVVILLALEFLLPGRQLGTRKRRERSSKDRGFNPLDWLE